jgi:hypothetical protein
MPIVYDWKGNIGRLQNAKKVMSEPLYQTHMDSCSSSVESIEGCLHALVFVHAATGYRWIYGLKTKGEALNAVKSWYTNFLDFRAKHKLVVLI